MKLKRGDSFVLVLVTAPELKVARRLAQSALRARLIACANLIPKIESHYRWEGKIEKAAEVFMIMKTVKTRVEALEKLIVAEHPYDTPEFLVLPLTAGNARYLSWIAESVEKE